MAAKSTSLGFLDLPAEVRNQIYSHLFQNAILSVEPAFPVVSHCGYSICPCQFPHGILGTCRRLRQEATALLLAGTTLRMSSIAQKLYLLPPGYLAGLPQLIVTNVGQYLKQPLDFSRFAGLRMLEFHNIAIWCVYHRFEDLDDALMLSLSWFNVKRRGAELVKLLEGKERRSFRVLLHCRFVLYRQETVDAVLDMDDQKVVQCGRGPIIKDRNTWAGFY